MKFTRAFTLIEILVVVAIMLVLYAILTPILSQAKKAALATDDLVRLQQLGHAAALYTNDTERPVRNCAELVEAQAIKSSMCVANLDDTKEGFANIALAQSMRNQGGDKFVSPKPYRMSFIGLRDMNVNSSQLEAGAPGTRGWLVDIGKSIRTVPNRDDPAILGMHEGIYRRLLDSGSVVTRRFIFIKLMWRGQLVTCNGQHWAYVDFPKEWMEQDCKRVHLEMDK